MASSSARRVARVASRSGGGKSPNKQRAWLFPASIVAVVVIGLGIVIYARSTNEAAGSNDTPPRAQLAAGEPSDHWHAAFAVDICGEEQPPVADVGDDVLGIHTHQDGLIHIHPFATRAAGDGATMSRFFDQTGIEVTDTAIKMPDGKVYKEGDTTCDGKPGEVQLAVWDQAVKAPTTKPDRVVTSDIGGVNFDQNYMAMTLAFVPKGDTIMAPSTSSELKTLGECDGENPPPECETLNTPSSVPAAGNPATATTAPSGGSTTSAPAGNKTTTTKGG